MGEGEGARMTDEQFKERLRTLRVAVAAREARRAGVADGAPEQELRRLVAEETAAWADYEEARLASMCTPVV